MPTTTTSNAGRDLRRARARAGLSRAQLAALAGYSLAALANIEQGAVPRRSRVLCDAHAAIDLYMRNAATGNGGVAKTEPGGARHDGS